MTNSEVTAIQHNPATAVMRYAPKFDIGDTIFVVRGGQKHQRFYACPVCRGKGDVKVPGSTRLARCPECDGSGRLPTGTTVLFYTVSEVTVGQVTVSITTNRPHRLTDYEALGGGRWKEVRYMAHETGVGSGSVYVEPMCFADEASARAFAAKQGWVTKAEAKAVAPLDSGRAETPPKSGENGSRKRSPKSRKNGSPTTEEA